MDAINPSVELTETERIDRLRLRNRAANEPKALAANFYAVSKAHPANVVLHDRSSDQRRIAMAGLMHAVPRSLA